MSFFEKLFGSFSDKELKRINPLKDKVLALEPEMAKLTDDELKAKTTEFKERLAKGETLDDLLPEAFAVCREADWRVLGMKPYPVQIIGGIVLHRACIAEMQTGEGKTLVATMPTYLNALTGEGVHVVTVNDYLARRDSEWMGKVYRFLGLTVGLVVHGVEAGDRKKAYEADVTYGTNNEFGFDYLRDNMVVYKANMVQRGHAFAIVDEVDSILIDEARTPLIISGKGEDSSVMYKRADDFAKTLKKSVIVELDDKVEAEEQVDGDYVVDEKRKTATLTESGVKKAEAFFHVENLADADNMSLRHYIDGAIKARGVMHRDTDYIVKDGEVIIVDEFTGRLMYGRRFNDGLHQAIEAKEGVTVAAESKTLATVTFQNYFRMYKKLSGMTGTASTEADEFSEIYGLNIVSIPTNKPRARKDLPDSVYKTVNGKYNAVIEQVAECHAKGQPVLVGTVSVEKSEALSKLLKKKGIEHNVLNAKQHEREAEIVAQAGKQGAVTIATNMAGRGTDIMLGGNVTYMAKAALKKELSKALTADLAQLKDEYEHAKARGAKIYCEVVGGGASADAYHFTAPHPEGKGAMKAMRDAIKDAGIAPEDIDYVNVHGTSTPAGDIPELKAVAGVLGDHVYNVNISSTKSMTGHLLGAAGAVEALACIFALTHGVVPPTINCENRDPEIDEKLNLTLNVAQKRDVKCALSNTFGFGGHNSTVIFRKL